MGVGRLRTINSGRIRGLKSYGFLIWDIFNIPNAFLEASGTNFAGFAFLYVFVLKKRFEAPRCLKPLYIKVLGPQVPNTFVYKGFRAPGA